MSPIESLLLFAPSSFTVLYVMILVLPYGGDTFLESVRIDLSYLSTSPFLVVNARQMARSSSMRIRPNTRLDHLDLERERIETMLRRDARRFLFQLIGLILAAMLAGGALMGAGAAVWEAIKP